MTFAWIWTLIICSVQGRIVETFTLEDAISPRRIDSLKSDRVGLAQESTAYGSGSGSGLSGSPTGYYSNWYSNDPTASSTSSGTGNNEVLEDYIYDEDEAPETVLGYLFKEAFSQWSGSSSTQSSGEESTKSKSKSKKSKKSKKKGSNSRGDKIQNRQSQEILDNDIDDDDYYEDEDNDNSIESVPQGPGFRDRVDRLFDTFAAVTDDPVFNWIFWFSVLALGAQSFVTPFGKVTVTNKNTGKRRKKRTAPV